MPLEIKIPLDIPDVRLLATEITDDGEFIISVESTLEGTPCRRCGTHSTEFHGHDEAIRLRHLPILNRSVWIQIRPRRYRCPWCRRGPTTTQRTAGTSPAGRTQKPTTSACCCCSSTRPFRTWRAKKGIGYKAVLGALRHQIRAAVNWDALEQLGTLWASTRSRSRKVTRISSPSSPRASASRCASSACSPPARRRPSRRFCARSQTGCVRPSRACAPTWPRPSRRRRERWCPLRGSSSTASTWRGAMASAPTRSDAASARGSSSSSRRLSTRRRSLGMTWLFRAPHRHPGRRGAGAARALLCAGTGGASGVAAARSAHGTVRAAAEQGRGARGAGGLAWRKPERFPDTGPFARHSRRGWRRSRTTLSIGRRAGSSRGSTTS